MRGAEEEGENLRRLRTELGALHGVQSHNPEMTT